jgi:hypothetical protein
VTHKTTNDLAVFPDHKFSESAYEARICYVLTMESNRGFIMLPQNLNLAGSLLAAAVNCCHYLVHSLLHVHRYSMGVFE